MIRTKRPAAEPLSVLLVDDDKLARELIAGQLKDCAVDASADFAGGRAKLESGSYDLCFIDLHLGGTNGYAGLDLIPLAKARGFYPVVMSDRDDEETVAKAYQLGCEDFYSKGDEEASVAAVLKAFLEKRNGLDAERVFTQEFVTRDPATRSGILEALKYAKADLPLMILGPSGTGKTRLARVLHDHSGRAGEFVSINCSSYTEDLLEVELFGCKRGAFTGAAEDRKGKLLLAKGGTLFLDEIGAMSLGMQTKLLKALEERSFYPLGSDKPVASDFRIISGTLEDLQALLAEGKLRFDFFQRIHGLPIKLNPLAQRKGDILLLIEFFTRGGKRLSFDAAAKTALIGHSWPGNIRELERVVKLLVSGGSGRIGPDDLLKHLSEPPRPGKPGAFATEAHYRHALEHGLYPTLDRVAEELVLRSLDENEGRKSRTMAQLKISSRLVYSVLKKRGESDERPK